MARVIFVDDEPHILSGLKRMLRPMRHEWDMVFAEGGAQALALLDEAPADAVVSDMRMPGMDGAELLSRVEAAHPNTIRIVLSGQTDEEATFRIVGTSHQFLSKPCDSVHLIESIRRSLNLRQQLRDPRLQGLVTGLRQLPSPPGLHRRLMDEIASPTASMRAVADLVSQDMGLSAKLLQLANSAYFGVGRNAATPAQAVNILGLETLKALVLHHGLVAALEGEATDAATVERLWRHSSAVGGMARAVAEMEGLDARAGDYAYVAGLLHDVGQLLLLTQLGEAYGEVRATAAAAGEPIWRTEKRVLGASHALVGAYLAELWGLPHDIVAGIAHHHELSVDEGAGCTTALAVHVANGLHHALDEGGGEADIERHLDVASLRRVGLAARLPAWAERCRDMARTEDEA